VSILEIPCDAVPADDDGADGGAARVRIAIVGSGFAGLGLAIRLKHAGIEDFVVLERADDVGGTWQANTYPGCQCDIPSHLYSFSFAPNPSWSRTYSRQPEIWSYLRDLSRRHGIDRHVRLGHELTAAEWDEEAQRWRVQTTRGAWTAQLLVDATGALSQPSVPALPGLERFEGTIFHSARWDHDHDLTGERVAVVGTGASAIQLVPRIQRQVARMHVFQRTAPWIMPHTDRSTTRLERRLYRALPIAQRLVRHAVYWHKEALVLGMAKDRRFLRPLERIARLHLSHQVHDPELRRKLAPRFRLGCKRILISNDWYPALTQPNVEVVTEAIREIRATSIVCADGSERDVDTIIFATGFHVSDPPTLQLVRGRGGHTLADRAAGVGIQAYLGTTIAGMPNFFKLTGPNTGLGHNSMVFMIEAQLRYVLDALRVMDEGAITSFDVRPAAQAAYNERLQAMMPGTVWMSGCASWYLDAAGRNVTIWPDFTWRYRRRTRRFDALAYELRAGAAEPGVGAAASTAR
jgi:cation diffusion facilitator CzcD-associated flavoprotein CzcO